MGVIEVLLNWLSYFNGVSLEPTEWGPRPDFKEPDVQEYIIDGIVSRLLHDNHMQ